MISPPPISVQRVFFSDGTSEKDVYNSEARDPLASVTHAPRTVVRDRWSLTKYSLLVSNDMEDADGVSPASADGDKIMVSNSKKPLFHYVRLAEKFLAKRDVVTLCGIGAAVGAAASVSEILKSKGVAVVTRIHTGTVTHVDEKDPDVRSQKSTLEIDVRRA
jgi:DNA-binding protein